MTTEAVGIIRIIIMWIIIRINIIMLIIISSTIMISIIITLIRLSQLISQEHLMIICNALILIQSVYQVPICLTQVTESTGWRAPHFAR